MERVRIIRKRFIYHLSEEIVLYRVCHLICINVYDTERKLDVTLVARLLWRWRRSSPVSTMEYLRAEPVFDFEHHLSSKSPAVVHEEFINEYPDNGAQNKTTILM
jgi:hypothetical protein